jgi:hypothetical protein
MYEFGRATGLKLPAEGGKDEGISMVKAEARYSKFAEWTRPVPLEDTFNCGCF